MAKKFDFLSPGIDIREVDQSFLPLERDAEGPIIIGRTRKGPANTPVKIRNLDDFISVFGRPVAGGNGALGDIWREGNTTGPTYASYAAQSWLASGESAVTVVRIAGEQHSNASSGGEAGWQVGAGGITNAAGTNTTAYGLFVCDEADTGELNKVTLKQGSGFAANDVGNSGQVKLRFIQGAAASGLASAAAAADGLKFEVIFDETVDITAAASRNATGGTGGDTALITVGCNASGGTITEIMAQIEKAIDLAIESGDITSIAVVNQGTTLEIFNQSTTLALVVADAGAANHIAGVGLEADGAGDVDADLQIANTSVVLAATATQAAVNGSLAAVFYATEGSLALSGKLNNNGSTTETAGALIESSGNNCLFTLKVFNSSNTEVDSVDFNFSRNSTSYIRNVFNTNPQLTNADTDVIAAADKKTYFLGESFVDHLDTNVDLAGNEGTVFAILMPMGVDDTAANNWGYHRYSARAAKSGIVFSDRSTNEQKLFRFVSHHVGEDIMRNYLIAIEDIKAPVDTSVNGYGTFTVCIKDIAGSTIEKFSNLNLNPASPNYIAARIGDQRLSWSDTDKRYRLLGDFRNQSDIFYVEMQENVANGGGQGLLPAGFFGPVRPKGFSLINGANTVASLDGTADFAGSVIRTADSANLVKGHGGTAGDVAQLGDAEQARFIFPQLRMRNNGSDGGASDQARTYWGIRPKVNASSTQHDPDYIDYLRPLGMQLGEEGTHTPTSTNFEYSFVFSLDDVSGSLDSAGTAINVWTWASGNFGNTVGAEAGDGASFTSKAGKTFSDLLDEGVRQFIMPVWGGSEGFDIKEMEPLRNELVDSANAGSLQERANYVDYSIAKALDSVSDAEVVPANLLIMPGIFKPAATNRMINVAESRKDVLAIIDIEGDFRPRVERNQPFLNRLGGVTSAVTSLKTRALNSSFACAFYPAIQVSDNLNGGQQVGLPASIAGLGAMAKSQAQSELWFAPAGFNRGGLGSLGGPRGPRVLQARQRLDSKERDLLYEVNINPIATFPAEGVVIFGQKTLQADASALDRINVRRLLLFLKSEVGAVARNLLFDNNLPTTWARFKNQVNPILASTQARFGLADYKLVLDTTTTTPDLIDRNIMYAKIFIKPARAIEFIVVDFVITNTGADFV